MVVGVYPQHSEVRVITNFKKGPASVNGGVSAATSSKQDMKTYTFDQTYGALSTQEEVYNQAVKPLVEEVLAGFSCTVFASVYIKRHTGLIMFGQHDHEYSRCELQFVHCDQQ